MVSNLESLEQYSVIVRKKRQTTTSSAENSTSGEKSPELLNSNDSRSKTASLSNNTDSSFLDRSISPKNDSSNVSVSATKSTMLLDQRLLGVNGTGQRRNITKAFTVSEPIAGSDSSATIQNVDSTTEESLNDEIDISDEETQKLGREHNITQFKEVCAFR